MSQLNWGDVRNAMKGDTGNTRVPDGTYECVVKTTQVDTTKGGYRKIVLRFVVLSGPYEGASVFRDLIHTHDKPGGLDMFGRALDALGVKPEQLTDDLPFKGLADMLVGRFAQIKVATRIWNEREYADVKEIRPMAAPGTGFAFGSSTIPAAPSTPMPSVPSVPSTPSVPPIPMPVMDTVPAVPVPVTVPAAPADGDNGLPPEPPF